MIFTSLVALVALLAGGVASVAGFGIGSVLTPLIATRYGMKLAVALVAIPHFTACGRVDDYSRAWLGRPRGRWPIVKRASAAVDECARTFASAG